MTPLVSICMPTYNVAEYIPECIDSIIAQTYKNWELLIVDDGSTDSTPDILNYYRTQDVRINYKRARHRGIAVTRNHALLMAKGDYIAVMDADDVMTRERLAIALKTLEKTKADVFYSAYARADIHGKIQDGIIPTKKLNAAEILFNQGLPHVTCVAKTKCFRDHPYRVEFTVNDDLALVWDFYRAGYKFCMSKIPTVMVRYHGQSTSATKDALVKKFTAIIHKEIKESGLQ